MTAAFALVLAASSAPVAPVTLHGACIYPPALGQPGADRSFVQCDVAEPDADGIEFRQSAWDARFRFDGAWHGNVLRVAALTPRTGAAVPARGTCRVSLTDGRVSWISCHAVVEGRDWVANFRNSQ